MSCRVAVAGVALALADAGLQLAEFDGFASTGLVQTSGLVRRRRLVSHAVPA